MIPVGLPQLVETSCLYLEYSCHFGVFQYIKNKSAIWWWIKRDDAERCRIMSFGGF